MSPYPALAGRQILVQAANTNHARIARPAVDILRSWGVRIRWMVDTGSQRWEKVCAEFEALGDEPVGLYRIGDCVHYAQPGDALLVFVMGTGGPRKYLETLEARGVCLMQPVEGGRFAAKIKHDPRVTLLGWGPSALDLGVPATVVGSPVIEDAAQRGRATPEPFALVNLKFGSIDEGAARVWLKRVLKGCAQAGVEAVVSGHPRDLPADLKVPLSPEPVADLARRAMALISRPSTVVYEALAAGTPAILVKVKGDLFREFADPLGAYPILRRPPEIAEALAAIREGRWPHDPRAFLRTHVSIDPERPAGRRMAEAVGEIWSAHLARQARERGWHEGR